MDTLRGNFDRSDAENHADDYDVYDEAHDSGEAVDDMPPAAIGQDERRMQVRAYNHWAGLLGDSTFPSIEDLEPENLTDFGPYSVLLDFSSGIEDPAVQYLGEMLATECDADRSTLKILSDVPPRSLLSRITDHYMQILANQAPIGFEAEFVNQRGATILYRGILLPFSSDDESIDFIYGVINWKEMADQETTDALLQEIDQALQVAEEEEIEEDEPEVRPSEPLTDWADSPSAELPEDDASTDPLPQPDFGQYALDDPDADEEDSASDANYSFASLTDHIKAPAEPLDLDNFVEEADDDVGDPVFEQVDPDATLDLDTFEEPSDETPAREPAQTAFDAEAAVPVTASADAPTGLHDCLASARELAQTARTAEDRSRKALYDAVSRAYDFALLAEETPAEYEELIAENGLSVQERAPMTPIVKLVFGADYDKTRLTEYAAVLSHAKRNHIGGGELAEALGSAPGGLKGVVAEERRIRREESGKTPAIASDGPRSSIAKKLRKLDGVDLDTLEGEGAEFAVVMIRRDADGVSVLGEISDDVSLVERTARKLIG
jgi:hypothetical protein